MDEQQRQDPSAAPPVAAGGALEAPASAALEAELRRTRAELRRLNAAVNNVVDAIVIIDDQLRVRFANAAADRLLTEGRGVVGADGLSFVHPGDRDRVLTDFAELVAKPCAVDVTRFRVRVVDGWCWVEAAATNLLDDPDVAGVVVSFRDLTHQRALEQSASHDPLTGLANRGLLADRLANALARARRDGGRVAVLFVDLDHFKVINDNLGHGAGDELLTRVADRLRRGVREADTIARFGGDEFVVLMTGVEGADAAAVVAARVLELFAPAVEVAGREVAVGASIGIALSGADADASDPDTLLRNADAAMYHAKARRGGWRLYSPELRRAARSRVDLERELTLGLERRELDAWYQPIVDARSQAVVGLEALARWRHPRRGVLEPDEFLPFAEQVGLADRVQGAVADRVCLDVLRLRAAGHADLRVAVNVLPRQLRQPGWAQHIGERLARHGIEGSQITLEIAEHALLDDDGALGRALAEVRGHGVRVAIDDFGGGRSSLARLADTEVDEVKIDSAYLRGLGAGARRRTLLASLIGLAHGLGAPVVAKGVESEAERATLVELDCDLLQGRLLGAPAELDSLLALSSRGAGELGPNASGRLRPVDGNLGL